MIQDALRDKAPRTSHQLINRVANRLSTKKRTVGTIFAHISSLHSNLEDATHDHGLVTLGHRYGGNAKRLIKMSGPIRFTQRGRGGRAGSSTSRRLISHWMRGVRGCFVCGKDHRPKDRHSQEEFHMAVQRLEEKNTKALLTIEDVAFLT